MALRTHLRLHLDPPGKKVLVAIADDTSVRYNVDVHPEERHGHVAGKPLAEVVDVETNALRHSELKSARKILRDALYIRVYTLLVPGTVCIPAA